MTKLTTNLLGILITILAGTYFSLMYCAPCNADGHAGFVSPAVSESTYLLNTCTRLPGVAALLLGDVLPDNRITMDDRSVRTFTNQP
jgi:hypothetical protein